MITSTEALQKENDDLRKVIEQLKWDGAYECYTRAGMEYLVWPAIAESAAWMIVGDIDHMHELNAQYTHNGMDRRIRNSIKNMRSSDYVACRIKSGDELGWVVTESPERDVTDIAGMAKRLQESFALNGIQITLGVARVVGHSFTENIDRAEALYERAKNEGRRGRSTMSSKNVFITDELREKRTQAGRKGRGASAIANSEPLAGRPNKQKARELQARIDMVVEKALSDAQQAAVSGQQDVMHGGAQLTSRHGNLKALKVG